MGKEQKLLSEIREYTLENKDLLENSHHFLFGCPIQKDDRPADIVVIGLNPGGDPKEDYRKLLNGHPFPTEESSEYDWMESDQGEVRETGRWSRSLMAITGPRKVVLTESFFWNSTKTDKRFFEDRYGYSFRNNPHWGFCTQKNLQLIDIHDPKLILAKSSDKFMVEMLAEKFNLKAVDSFKLPPNKKGHTTSLHHYELNEKPFIFAPHPNYQLVKEGKEIVRGYISKLLNPSTKG